MRSLLAGTALGLAQLLCVAAHGGVVSYDIDGTHYDGFHPYNTPVGQSSIQRVWNKYDPLLDVSLNNIACNDGDSNPGQLTATVAAGKKITGLSGPSIALTATANWSPGYWNNPWPHNTGPLLAYLGQCPSSGCTGVSPNSVKWFKIVHEGLLSGTVGSGNWASGRMITNNNSWTVTIPSTVPAGNYFFRMETIALHSLPAQSYPECAQLQITGSGNIPPSSDLLVSFPGAYKQSDPGLSIDIYSQAAKTQTTYEIPGPAVYPGGSTSVPQSSPPPTSTRTTSQTTPRTTPQTTTRPGTTTTTANQSTQTKYGQCGGTGWSGPTACASGSTCVVLNQYYSQCQ